MNDPKEENKNCLLPHYPENIMKVVVSIIMCVCACVCVYAPLMCDHILG